MEVEDELLHYIPEITEDIYQEISQFVRLPSDTLEVTQYVIESNNNNELDKSEYSGESPYTSCVKMCSDDKNKDAEETAPAQKYKAKRGRPPSKPPTWEVVRKRRMVSLF